MAKPILEEVLRQHELSAYDGLKRSQRDALIKRGEYPRPVKLSARRKAWLKSEIAAWQRKRIAERDVGRPKREPARGIVAQQAREAQR